MVRSLSRVWISVGIFLWPLTFFPGANVSSLAESPELSVKDFLFEGPLGSSGAQVEKLGKNHFRIVLGHAPQHPGWPNKLNFQLVDNARGNSLRLDVVFPGGPQYSFNEYSQSWSYNGRDWRPVHWVKGFRQSPQEDTLYFPTFKQDRVYVGTQVPMSYQDLQSLVERWQSSPYVKVHIVGRSAEGRNLYRLEVTDPESLVPPERRWGHYFANQHPSEHNSQWRMVGMIDWLLSTSAAAFRRNNICHFVLMMSPDAPSHGWYRVNSAGVDMNRSYRAEGSSSEHQTLEPYLWQKDLESIMVSATPVTTIWAIHTWQETVEPILTPGPEMGTRLEPWTRLRELILENDLRGLIEPLKIREDSPRGDVTWTAGPHKQFGITAVLCEGGGHLYTREDNEESGRVLIQSLAGYYAGSK